MKNNRLAFAVALVVGFSGAATLAAGAYTGQNLASHAKVSIQSARTIAHKAQPGKITAEELENEGSGLRYSFDIKVGPAMHEGGVDAQSGKVLENSVEGANSD